MNEHNDTTGAQQTGQAALTTPPEGVLAGESIPRENEQADYDQALVEEVEAILKSHGEPFTSMSDDELRENAIERIDRHRVGGVDF